MIWRRKTNEFDKSIEEINKSEMERITQELIEEVVGKHGEISNCLNSLLESYNAKNNPIGRDEAKTILLVLIRIGVTKRRRLSQKVSESLEHGRLFQYYNNRLSQIDRLTEEAFLAMKEMQSAREKYEREKNIYENISGKAYERSIDLKESSNDIAGKKVEMWNELDKEIEINHNESNYKLLMNYSQLPYVDDGGSESSTTPSDNTENLNGSNVKTNLSDSHQQAAQSDTDAFNSDQEHSNDKIILDLSKEAKTDQENSAARVISNDVKNDKSGTEDQAQVNSTQIVDDKTDQGDLKEQDANDGNLEIKVDQQKNEAPIDPNNTTEIKTESKESESKESNVSLLPDETENN